jgi:hypothetical protein
LLSPLTFHLLNRRGTDAWPGAATAVFVLFDNSLLLRDSRL